MDADRFDALAKTVFAASRRGLLGSLAALAGLRVLDRPAAAQVGCVPVGLPCSRGPCCSGRCKNGVCARRRCETFDDCPSGLWCVDGECSCLEEGTCRGCCNADRSACLPGTHPDACGRNGQSCDICEEERALVCRNRRCCYPDDVPCVRSEQCCDGSSCSVDERTGKQFCCASTRRCLVGGLAICCEAGQRCQDRKCVCDEPTCAALKGCCKDDRCVPDTEPTACGSDGKACKACPTGLDCDVTRAGASVCRCVRGINDRCAGCCSLDKTTCKTGTDPRACGNHGETCQDCWRRGPGWTCKNRTCRQTGCSTPGSAPCPTGTCCDPATKTCQPGTTDQACHAPRPAGIGACEACGPGEVCTPCGPRGGGTSVCGFNMCCATSQACPTQCCALDSPGARCCFPENGVDACAGPSEKCCPPGSMYDICGVVEASSPEQNLCCPPGSAYGCCLVGERCCPEGSRRFCCSAETAHDPNCCA